MVHVRKYPKRVCLTTDFNEAITTENLKKGMTISLRFDMGDGKLSRFQAFRTASHGWNDKGVVDFEMVKREKK